MNALKPCPFCGGKAKLSFKQREYYGQNVFGNKKMKYCVQVICNRCFARGRLITTDWMIDPNPRTKPDEFSKYIIRAIMAWNIRNQGE